MSLPLPAVRRALDPHRQLPDPCWRALQETATEKALTKGAYFSRQGHYVRELAFALEGVLRVFYLTAGGREITKYFVTPGEFIMASVEPKQPSQINLQAITDFRYISIAYPVFENCLAHYSALALVYNQRLLAYFGRKQEREIRLLKNTALENYRLFLKEYPDLECQIPQYYIASYLGITPTQLSRIRKKMPTHPHL